MLFQVIAARLIRALGDSSHLAAKHSGKPSNGDYAMNTPKSGESVDLSEHMLATYQTLRVVMFVVGFSLPWVLWIGGILSKDNLKLQGSMSAYYHAKAISDRKLAEGESRKPDEVHPDHGPGVMRDWFVGSLFLIGALLIVYKGYRPAEDRALNLAGVFAILVALFPTPREGASGLVSVHGVCAFCFFVCIAYVCIRCASATLTLVANEDRDAHYRRWYIGLGWAMVISPVSAFILALLLGSRSSYLFFAETFGVSAFAIYWLVKTFEIRETDADRKAASGELQLPPGRGPSDAVREIPVTYVKRQNVEVMGRDAAER